MRGYHYTSQENYKKIRMEGLLPSPINNKDVLVVCRGTEGSWLFQNRQKEEALFGQLIDLLAKTQSWKFVELGIDFEITDCLKALQVGNTLLLKHKGSCGSWIYHKDEPIIIISKVIPVCQIELLQVFNLRNAIVDILEGPFF